MRLADIVLDNPILVKHARSRLRRGHVLPFAAVVLVMSASAAWVGEGIPWIGHTTAVVMMLGLQVLLLVFGGTNQFTVSLGGARESGILDFHRVSPLPPSVVALGFFLGAPIREYVLAAITLPFVFWSAYNIDVMDPWRGVFLLVQLELGLLLSVWVVHAAAMLSCLTRKKPRGTMQGTVVAIVVMLFFGYLGAAALYLGVRWLMAEPRTMNFFGWLIPWLAWLCVFELPLIGFLGLAVARKMTAERTHGYTKPQALAFMSTFGVLAVGGLWKVARLLEPVAPFEPTPSDAIMLASVYLFSIVAMIMALPITPDAGEYVKGLRRAGRMGRRRSSPWSDAGSSRVALFILCALVLAGVTTVVNVVGRAPLRDPATMSWVTDQTAFEHMKLDDAAWLASRQAMMSRPIAIGVLTVAYVGLAIQYFSLRTRSSGPTLTALFLFTVWLVPILAGAAIGMSGRSEQLALAIVALSPLPGLALSSGLGRLPGADTIQLAALAPPITFAFLLNYLLVIEQRKLDRQFHTKDSAPALPLLEKATAEE